MTSPSSTRIAAAVLAALLAGCAHTDVSEGGDAAAEALYVARDVVGDGAFGEGIEGPAFGPDGALYAVGFGRGGRIGRVTFDADGFMYVADYTGHHILRIDPRDRSVGVFATLSGAHQPNDLAFAPNGMFYASDPDWRTGTGQLWRILPYGRAALLETGMGTTNGVEVGPRGDVLYVNESVQRRVWAYDLDASGGISGKRLLIAFPDHGLDGMRTDVRGNLYIARYGAGTVAVVSPQGELLHEVRLKGRKPTNVAFGGPDGRTVFVTLQDRGAIEAFRTELPGRETGP